MMKQVSLVAIVALIIPVSGWAQLIDPNRRCVVQAGGSCTPIPQQARPAYPPPPQPMLQSANSMFCFSDGAVPGTKNAFISNVFQTNRSPDDTADEFNQYSRQQNYAITFTCVTGDDATLRQQLTQKTINLANRGFNVGQIQHR